MRIGIIGPMDEEVALLQAAFTIKETQTIGAAAPIRSAPITITKWS